MKKYIIKLSIDERNTLKKLITSGRGPARMFTRARILLKADQGASGPNWSDEKISDALDVTVQTAERVRKQFVEEGFDAVLSRRQYTQKVSRKKRIQGRTRIYAEQWWNCNRRHYPRESGNPASIRSRRRAFHGA